MTDIFSPGSRVIGYCRDSGGRNQELSTRQQREQIGTWCLEHDLILSRIFEDIAKSGASTAGRTQFLAMIDYFSGKVPERGVVLWEFARLSRDYDDLMYFVSDLKRQGYIIHSISDSVPEGLEGNLLLGIKAYSNAKFLLDLRRNVRRGLHFVVRSHHANVARAPIGLKAEQEVIGKHRDGSPHTISRLAIDKSTAPLVRKAFELRARGATLKEIHEQIHLFDWYLSYRRLFRNTLYIGVKTFGDETIPDFCPAIIPLPLWNDVQRIMDARMHRHGTNHPRAVRSRFWLTGLLYCGVCSRPMHGHLVHKKGEKPHDYYFCTSYHNMDKCANKIIRKDVLEPLVMQSIIKVLNNKEIIDQVYGEAQAQELAKSDNINLQLVTIQQEVTNHEKQIARLLLAIKETGHSRAMLDDLAKLESEKIILEQSIAKIEMPEPDIIKLSRDELEQNFVQILESANEIERGQIARDFIQRIEVTKGGKEIRGKVWMSIVNPGDIVISL